MISEEDKQRCSAACTCGSGTFTEGDRVERGLLLIGVAKARGGKPPVFDEDGCTMPDGVRKERAKCHGCFDMFKLTIEEVFGKQEDTRWPVSSSFKN